MKRNLQLVHSLLALLIGPILASGVYPARPEQARSRLIASGAFSPRSHLPGNIMFASGARRAQARRGANKPLDPAVTKPESVGFSSERLERLHALMQQTVDQKQLPGIVTILARHGKIVDYKT